MEIDFQLDLDDLIKLAKTMSQVEQCDPSDVYENGYFVPNCPEHMVVDLYTNNCVTASLIQFNDQENEPAMHIIYGYILPLLSTIVLVSHTIVIWVLYKQKNRRASVEPLLWMALCALLMAISPLPFTIYYYNLNHRMDLNQTVFLCYLQKISMELLPFFFNTLVTFFTILLGTQRFIAIQYPLDSFRLCSRAKIRFYSKLIIIFSVLITVAHSMFDIRTIYHYCIQAGIGNGITQHFWVARCFVGYSDMTIAIGPDVLSDVFDMLRIGITVIPSLILFVITILLIKTVRATDQAFVVSYENKNISVINRHKKITRSSRNTTVMLTVIIALFLLGRMPSTILILLMKTASYLRLKFLDFVFDSYLRAFTNIVMMTVHPISFAVYMLMSRRFRVTLRKLFGFRCLASDEELKTFNSSLKTKYLAKKTGNKDSLPLITKDYEVDSCQTCCSTARETSRETGGDTRRGVVFATQLTTVGLPKRSVSNPIELMRRDSQQKI